MKTGYLGHGHGKLLDSHVEEASQIGYGRAKLGHFAHVIAHPSGQLTDRTRLCEPLVAQHDRTVVVAMSNHTSDRLIDRSIRLLIVPQAAR